MTCSKIDANPITISYNFPLDLPNYINVIYVYYIE